MKQQVIFFNGPPYCGKDTLAKAFAKMAPAFKVVKFARILKEHTHALYGFAGVPHDHFENVKDMPCETFLGKTPRQAYIAVSETLMKPLHGEEVFGELLLKELKKDEKAKGFLISDSGFAPEAMPVIRHFGEENCLLVRIRADERGCSFKGDSRGYIDLPIETIDIQNNSTEYSFVTQGAYRVGLVLQSRVGGQ